MEKEGNYYEGVLQIVENLVPKPEPVICAYVEPEDEEPANPNDKTE